MKLKVVTLLLFIFLKPIYGQEMRTLVFGISASEESVYYKQATVILDEAVRRLGYEFKVRSMPLKRSIELMRVGRIDGDAGRIFDFNIHNDHPSYIRVDESYLELSFDLYSADPSLSLKSWHDIINSNLRIGYQAGVKKFEQKLKGVGDQSKLLLIYGGMRDGVRVLASKRVDIFLYVDGIELAPSPSELRQHKVFRIGTIEKSKIYPYLHSKHKELAAPLAEKIREMKADGSFKRVLDGIKY